MTIQVVSTTTPGNQVRLPFTLHIKLIGSAVMDLVLFVHSRGGEGLRLPRIQEVQTATVVAGHDSAIVQARVQPMTHLCAHGNMW